MQWLSRWVEQYAEQEKLIERVKAWGGTVEVNVLGPAEPLDRSRLCRRARQGGRHYACRAPRSTTRHLANLVAQRRMLAGLRKLALIDTAVTRSRHCSNCASWKPSRTGPQRHRGRSHRARRRAARAALAGNAQPRPHRHRLAGQGEAAGAVPQPDDLVATAGRHARLASTSSNHHDSSAAADCTGLWLRLRPGPPRRLRPPAVPLVTIDPYMSCWSMGD